MGLVSLGEGRGGLKRLLGNLEPPKPMSGYVPVGENFIGVLAAMFGGLTKRGGGSALRLHSESKDCVDRESRPDCVLLWTCCEINRFTGRGRDLIRTTRDGNPRTSADRLQRHKDTSLLQRKRQAERD